MRLCCAGVQSGASCGRLLVLVQKGARFITAGKRQETVLLHASFSSQLSSGPGGGDAGRRLRNVRQGWLQ